MSNTEVKLRGIDESPNYIIPSYAEEGSMRKGSIAPSVDTKYFKHQAVMLSRLQSNDRFTLPFDFQSRAYSVSASASRSAILTVQLKKNIEGVLMRYGWYTDAEGASKLQFGLFVNGELVAPGGKFIENSNMSTVNDFEPSGSSIDFKSLCEVMVYVPEDSNIEVRVTNTDNVAHQAWCRVFGKHWPMQSISAYKRAYFDMKSGRIR